MYHLLDKWMAEDNLNESDGDDVDFDAGYFIDFVSEKINKEQCKLVFDNTVNQHQSDDCKDLKIGRIPCSLAYEASYKSKITSFKDDKSTVNFILGFKDFEDTPDNQCRLQMQEKIIDVISKQLKQPLKKSGLLLHPKYPILIGAPDALGPNFVVNIKCATCSHNVKDYMISKNKLTNECYAEIQLQMLLNESKKGYFCLAMPDFTLKNKLNILSIDYDQKYTERMIEQATNFWSENVFPKLESNVMMMKKLKLI